MLLMAVETDLVTGPGLILSAQPRSLSRITGKWSFRMDPANHQDIYKKAWRQ
jgi:hypothetical protein